MRTPSRSRRWVSRSVSSGSSCAMSRSSTSTTVTSAPSRRKAWASSTPIGPPPMTTSDAGIVSRSNASACVKKPASSRPGIGGIAARVPVAMTNLRARKRRPPTSTSCGDTKRADPSTTSTPMARKRSGSSCGSIRARTSRTLASTSAPLTSGATVRRPKAPASRNRFATRAEPMRALDGTHPVQRQSPPSRSRSTSAARAPNPALPAVVTRPAVPPPMATISKLSSSKGSSSATASRKVTPLTPSFFAKARAASIISGVRSVAVTTAPALANASAV